MTRKLLIVGNWKMHLNVAQSSVLVHRLTERIRLHRNIEVVLAPSMLSLQPLSVQIDRRKFRLAAQNAYQQDEGAFTGEVSFTMLRELVHYVIVGHSERRLYFHEDLPMVRDKVKAAIRNDISPILCVGETKHERKEGMTRRVLHDQVTTALSNLTSREIMEVVIAYEPVWAISTFGHEYAKPADIKEAMDYIRAQVAHLHGERVANTMRVLYGGSVDDTTVRGYLEIEGCDGVLVGGASINPYKFAGIVDAAYRLQTETNHEA
ncbi:MAG TPA: triose-phosphate isomerase [Candidatus Pristimantibacillus sp.]|jgi:triosephosphate isomerase|nr:triose-phosphate isomerase [Candidatus Pristimantibacillus sp.]